ncbi:MAG: LemA family protein [Gemmataceae bacterium]|nr:LemA family protein [Gemmataceae bacterium]
MHILALVGGVLLLIAWALWATVRRWDRANAVVTAAAPLPIPLVNVWDAVWIRGEVQCDQPCVVPHFRFTSVHFNYTLEELVTRVERTSDGKTRTTTSWVTRDQKDGQSRFRIRQGRAELSVLAEKAEWHYEQAHSETKGVWRHSCHYTPFPGTVSVIGVVGETKQTLEPLKHVPLIVTPMERKPYVARIEGAERWAARLGLFFLFLGAWLAFYGLWRKAEQEALPHDESWWNPTTALLAVAVALGVAAVFWALRNYNSLVVFRNRAEMSWSQIDVHLRQRYDLIPNLVEVVKGYAGHEQKSLEDLTAARSTAMTGDRAARVGVEADAVAGLSRVFVLAESYPNLKANEQFRKLAEQITALEDKIAHARGFFNDSVAEYNKHTAVFPASLVATLFRFKPLPLFAAELEEKKAPKIKLAKG